MKYTITLTEEEIVMVMNGLFEKSYYYHQHNRYDDSVRYAELVMKINDIYMKKEATE